MRILVVNLEYPPVGGGGANATYYLVSELVRRGHVVDVLTSCFPGLAKREMVAGATIYRVPVKRARIDFCTVREMLTFAVSAVPFALTLATQHRYDLTHVFFGVPCGHVGWLLKRTHGLPYVISTRGGDVPGFKPYGYAQHYRRVTPILRYLWQDCDALVSVSRGLADQMGKVDPMLTKVRVIPNGVDLTEFSPTIAPLASEASVFDSQAQTPGAGKPVRILCVTRLIRRKGLDFLIEAAALLRERTRLPFVIDIVGDGIYRMALERHVHEAHVGDILTFHGNVAHQELPEHYRRADIFCLPSLAEGMSNVLLEALASGLPLVATNVGGSVELIHPHVNGLLVRTRDAADLAEKLLELIENPTQRDKFARASRQRAQQFSWSVVADQYEDVYKMIRQGRSAATKALA